MSDLKLMIKGASSDDDDAYFLTSLATVWSRRMPALAQLRLFMDGRESVDSNSVPQGVDPDAAPVYRTMRSLGVMNFARRISESVTDRQQPNGFRKVEDTSLRDTEADLVAKRCGLPALLRRFMFPQKGTYGCSFGFVTRGRGKRSIIALSPWECWMSDDADSAIMYSHDERSGVERMRLFRILREDKTGEPTQGSPSGTVIARSLTRTTIRRWGGSWTSIPGTARSGPRAMIGVGMGTRNHAITRFNASRCPSSG